MIDPFAVPDAVPVRQIVRPARVRMRLKGRPDGPVFQGMEVIKSCASCGGTMTPDDAHKMTLGADDLGQMVIKKP